MPEIDVKTLTGLVGRAIARQRVRCELTQEQVAERLGIGNEAVSRIERGIVMPNIERLVALASIFGCETADLLTEASARPRTRRAISSPCSVPWAAKIGNLSWGWSKGLWSAWPAVELSHRAVIPWIGC